MLIIHFLIKLINSKGKNTFKNLLQLDSCFPTGLKTDLQILKILNTYYKKHKNFLMLDDYYKYAYLSLI